jgi:6-phosphogluconolactonase
VKGHYWVYVDAATAAAAAATHIAERLDEAVRDRGRATFAISGGNSPKPLFRELVKTGVDWKQVRLFWADERAVPPGDPQSNYAMALEHLIEPAGIPDANVVRSEAEHGAAEAAATASRCANTFPARPYRFDVILAWARRLHSQPLPGEPLILERHGLTAAVHAGKPHTDRITLLPRVLHLARCVIVSRPRREGPVLKKVFERGSHCTRLFKSSTCAPPKPPGSSTRSRRESLAANVAGHGVCRQINVPNRIAAPLRPGSVVNQTTCNC